MFTGDNDTVIGVEFRDVELTFNISRDLPSVIIEDIRWFFQEKQNITPRQIVNNHHYKFSDDKLILKLVNLSLLLDTGFYIFEASNIVGTGRDSVYLDIQSKNEFNIYLILIVQSFYYRGPSDYSTSKTTKRTGWFHC